MKKIFFASTLLISFLIASCDYLSNSSDKNLFSLILLNSNQVCCESFGYGSGMVKCCVSYAWTTASQCVVPADFVGGGKQIVDNSFCK